jgi:hypothetical protein
VIERRSIDINYPWLKGVGILFAALGIVYREMTCFSVDQAEFNLLNKDFQNKMHNVRRSTWQQLATMIRRITIRFFLFPPIVAWATFFNQNYLFCGFAISFLAALLLSIVQPRYGSTQHRKS